MGRCCGGCRRYDYLYLGDSARAPTAPRSFETIYEFTREAVEFLFAQGCPLVILACNTASARALRNLQQQLLPARFPDRRVLGVVRPVGRGAGRLAPRGDPGRHAPSDVVTGTVAVLATPGTVASDSYRLELAKLAPGLRLVQQACPLWVPLVEAGELVGPGRGLFPPPLPRPAVRAARSRPHGCCSAAPTIRCCCRASGRWLPAGTEVLAQGEIVAERLADWLRRHPEMETRLGQGGSRRYLTTDDPGWFAERGAAILGQAVPAQRVHL